MTEFKVNLHPKQMEVYSDPHRFRILCCGRRWGKSWMCAYIVIVHALSQKDSVLWIVSPIYPQTAIIWDMIKKFLPEEFIRKKLESDKMIELINGSRIYAKSADSPDSLRG